MNSMRILTRDLWAVASVLAISSVTACSSSKSSPSGGGQEDAGADASGEAGIDASADGGDGGDGGNDASGGGSDAGSDASTDSGSDADASEDGGNGDIPDCGATGSCVEVFGAANPWVCMQNCAGTDGSDCPSGTTCMTRGGCCIGTACSAVAVVVCYASDAGQ